MMIFFMLSVIYVGKELTQNYQLDLFKPAVLCGTVCCMVIAVYSALYSTQKKIYNYKADYCKTSDYLPLCDPNLACEVDLVRKWELSAEENIP